MSYIETSVLKNSTIMFLHSIKDSIQLDPDYQRMGGVWTLEKKQLFIDSILNDYDVPKLYFYEFSREEKERIKLSFSVIDGRQRLQSIWEFINGDFVLSNDIDYLKNSSIKLEKLSYEDIAKEFPNIRIEFDSFVLPVITIKTDDMERIEEMFSRLNEAVPLNAAEKRNAIGGRMVTAIRRIANSEFFSNYVKFKNNRYQHQEVAARMLLVEDSIIKHGRLIDTKKVYLDDMARKYKSTESYSYIKKLIHTIEKTLNSMVSVFTRRDSLLQAQGNMIVFYLLFRTSIDAGDNHKITRRKLINFGEKLKNNRIKAEKEYTASSFELLEYDRLTQQGTNDATNIKERFSILARELGLDITEIK